MQVLKNKRTMIVLVLWGSYLASGFRCYDSNGKGMNSVKNSARADSYSFFTWNCYKVNTYRAFSWR